MTSSGALIGLGALAVCLTTAAAGCAGAIQGAADPGDLVYTCWDVEIPPAVLSDPVPATALGVHGRAALDGFEMPSAAALGDLATWAVVTETADRLVLLRALPEPEDLGAGDVRSHEILVAEVVDAVNVQGWMLTRASTCALSVPGAGGATVTLDPDIPPDPSAAEVHLLVTEMACNSGQDAVGRVQVLALRQTPERVEVVLTVTPEGTAHTCQSNPPTPFRLDLDAPLGGRPVVDASVYPAREIRPPA